ncbi:MAG: right-handed parallel beta-helix repeat-containing protein, partial [Acidobacteriota bacterium]|nr:right-handed parallel beta-helix repeat-containing protein [Acidobacteriota bacterium]
GDTVQIPAGHYVLTLGHIVITQSVTLAGSGARTTVIDGSSTSGGPAGGILNISGALNVVLSDLSLVNGVADQSGGAIQAVGLITSFRPFTFTPLALAILRCTIDNNHVTAGQSGAMDFQLGTVDIEDSTFSNNKTIVTAGAINLNSVNGSIVNSTFSGNRGFFAAAMALSNGTISLINNTITGNTATAQGGGMRVVFENLIMSNNIIAGNMAGGHEGDCAFVVGNTTVTDHNIDGDGSCRLTGPGDQPGVANPLLAPLANNGGPTDTVALLGGSPAVNAGNNATCPPADQRGTARPQGASCDIGAYEDTLVSITVNSPQVTVNEGQTAANGGTVLDKDGDPVTLTASVGTVVQNGNGTWSWSFPVNDPAQSQTVTITATTDDGAALSSSVSFGLVVADVPPSLLSVTNNGPILTGGSATITVNAADTTGGNDTLSYEFDCNNDGIFEIGPQAAASASCTFASAGPHTVNVRVTDGEGGATLGSTVVLVNLDCSQATATPNLLFPPNHKLVPIQISGVQNPGGPPVTFLITSIFQDEPVGSGKNGCDGDDEDHGEHHDQSVFRHVSAHDDGGDHGDGGDGDHREDGTGVGTATASVRAERSCKGDGRIYHIGFTAKNSQGFSCTGSVTVGVPRHKNVPPVDGGSLFDSTKTAPQHHHDD